MPNAVYIHYGATSYDPDKFAPIKNKPLWVKPEGGLWASRVGTAGWKELCESEDYSECREENSFRFTLRPGANIVEIKSVQQLESLPHLENDMRMRTTWDLLDFETMLCSGVDAIEIFMNDALYFRVYGWDCSSLLVLNKDVIEPIK